MNWGQPARNQLRVHPGWPLNPSLNGGSAGLGGRSGVGSGGLPDDRAPGSVHAWGVPSFLLHHQHEPHECATAFAAWKGFDSPLRNRSALSKLPGRRPRTLVAGAGRGPLGGARAPAALRGRPGRADSGQTRADPLTRSPTVLFLAATPDQSRQRNLCAAAPKRWSGPKAVVCTRAGAMPALDDARASERPTRTRLLRQGETKAQPRARVTPVRRPTRSSAPLRTARSLSSRRSSAAALDLVSAGGSRARSASLAPPRQRPVVFAGPVTRCYGCCSFGLSPAWPARGRRRWRRRAFDWYGATARPAGPADPAGQRVGRERSAGG